METQPNVEHKSPHNQSSESIISEKTPVRIKKSVSFDSIKKRSYHSIDINRQGSLTRSRAQSIRESISVGNDEIVSGVRLRPHNWHSKRKPTGQRLVEKSGKRNVRSRELPRDRYIQDIFTTIIDAKWKWMLLLFTLFYLGSWVIFGVLWWIVFVAHGEKCFDNVHNFTEAFLLSVETSVTIGYGGRQITSDCPQAIIVLILQASLSCLTDAVIMGLIFTKVARPGKRQSTILFSEKAVINKKDDKYCLMFKIADVRKRQLAECHVRLHLFRKYRTLEGQVLSQHDQLRVGMDWYNIRDDSDRVFLMKPCNIVHVIDRKSPFYHMSKDKYLASDWELVVILEGIVEATGCTLQTRTSYLPSEVLWAHEFCEMADDWTEDEGILYTLTDINKLEPSPYFMPECSAYNYYKKIQKDPDPNDVYGEQDELWDDENFIPPNEGVDGKRVLPTHRVISDSENIVV